MGDDSFNLNEFAEAMDAVGLPVHVITNEEGGAMELPEISTVKTKEQARDIAIDWQHWVAEAEDQSYGELIEYADYFRQLGKKFGLIREFKENGIL